MGITTVPTSWDCCQEEWQLTQNTHPLTNNNYHCYSVSSLLLAIWSPRPLLVCSAAPSAVPISLFSTVPQKEQNQGLRGIAASGFAARTPQPRVLTPSIPSRVSPYSRAKSETWQLTAKRPGSRLKKPSAARAGAKAVLVQGERTMTRNGGAPA